MTYSIWTKMLLATALTDVDEELHHVMDPIVKKISKIVIGFLCGEVSPTQSFQFEEALQEVLRELGRVIAGWAYNRVEPDDPETLPHDVHYDGSHYRRLNHQTANRNVSRTRFGKIVLWRFGYRDWQREGGEPTWFPLERTLGLLGGATPALTSAVGRYFADERGRHARRRAAAPSSRARRDLGHEEIAGSDRSVGRAQCNRSRRHRRPRSRVG